MRIFLDTNVIIDVLTKREPFYESSLKIMQACDARENKGILASHTLLNIYYLMRKDYDDDARRDVLMDLTEMFEIEGVDKGKIQAAIANKDFSDFEDGVQYECAILAKADVIITRDVNHFKNSKVKMMTPSEFIEEYRSC